MRKCKHKGSFTIEASIWCPMILSMAAYVLQGGIGLYQEVRDVDFYQEEIQSMDIVEEFYHYQILKEVIEEVTDD